MSARVPAGEYRCDFYEFGCGFVATNSQTQTRHYESAEGRHEHIRLVSERLRNQQEKINRLQQSDKRNKQEIHRNKLEIEELKKKLHRLETHSLRVCAVRYLSATDMLAPSPEWHPFLTSEFGYGVTLQACLHLQDSPATFCFKLRLRPTPHDRTLQWPFRSTLRIDVFPPDGHQQLLPGGSSSATLVPESLPADQLRMLERPEADGDDASESFEIRLPVGFSLEQLRDLAARRSSFAVRVAILPEGAE